MRDGVRNPGWPQKDLVVQICVIFGQPFRRIGDCRLPSLMIPKMAYGSLALRLMVSERRVLANGWATDSPHSACRASWEVAARNNGRARRRWLRELAKAKSKVGEPIRTESGDIMNELSDDERPPYVSREDLATNSSFPLLGATRGSSGSGQQGEFAGSPSAPKR